MNKLIMMKTQDTFNKINQQTSSVKQETTIPVVDFSNSLKVAASSFAPNTARNSIVKFFDQNNRSSLKTSLKTSAAGNGKNTNRVGIMTPYLTPHSTYLTQLQSNRTRSNWAQRLLQKKNQQELEDQQAQKEKMGMQNNSIDRKEEISKLDDRFSAKRSQNTNRSRYQRSKTTVTFSSPRRIGRLISIDTLSMSSPNGFNSLNR